MTSNTHDRNYEVDHHLRDQPDYRGPSFVFQALEFPVKRSSAHLGRSYATRFRSRHAAPACCNEMSGHMAEYANVTLFIQIS